MPPTKPTRPGDLAPGVYALLQLLNRGRKENSYRTLNVMKSAIKFSSSEKAHCMGLGLD